MKRWWRKLKSKEDLTLTPRLTRPSGKPVLMTCWPRLPPSLLKRQTRNNTNRVPSVQWGEELPTFLADFLEKRATALGVKPETAKRNVRGDRLPPGKEWSDG